MLRVFWNPPRSNGALITQVVVHHKEVSADWRHEDAVQAEKDAAAAAAAERYVCGGYTVLEALAAQDKVECVSVYVCVRVCLCV